MRRKKIYNSTVSSLISLAKKFNANPQSLADTLIATWKTSTEQKIADLKIQCRTATQDSASFLIIRRGKIVTQFPVKSDVLKNSTVLKEEIRENPIFRRGPGQFAEKKIAELKRGMWVNIKAEVMVKPPKKRVLTKYGSNAYVSNAKIADETGSTTFALWNEDIDRVSVGDKIEIKRGYVTTLCGLLQIVLRKKSELTVKKHGF